MKKSPEQSPKRLLQSRKVTAQQLGLSLGTVIRLEQRGMLKPIKLSPRGMVLHRVEHVQALADGAARR